MPVVCRRHGAKCARVDVGGAVAQRLEVKRVGRPAADLERLAVELGPSRGIHGLVSFQYRFNYNDKFVKKVRNIE